MGNNQLLQKEGKSVGFFFFLIQFLTIVRAWGCEAGGGQQGSVTPGLAGQWFAVQEELLLLNHSG